MLQSRFKGHDLSTIRVNVGGHAEAVNDSLHSHAFTIGERISFRQQPDLRLAAHEAAHTVQHRAGLPPAEADRAEAVAEGVADRVAAGGTAGPGLRAPSTADRSPEMALLAPNQSGATDPSHVVGWVRTREAAGGGPGVILEALSNAHGGNSDRYFYTDTYGWVDIRHFGAAASYAVSTGSVVAEGLGYGNEGLQWLTEWGDDYRNGFSPEDTPSNAAGAEFGDDYVGSRPGESVADALERWMRDRGGRPASDPRAGRASLPVSDPSDRGGAGRGSSNASRTQSTASGEVSRTRESAESGVYQLNNPWNWYRMMGGL